MAALLLVGQTLGRQVILESAEYPTLRALGMTPSQLVAVAMIRAAVVGGVGAGLAAAVALALSPLTPIGLARRAERHPGAAADLPVLAAGGFAILTFVLVGAALPAWRAARGGGCPRAARSPVRRQSRKAQRWRRRGAGPAAVTSCAWL